MREPFDIIIEVVKKLNLSKKQNLISASSNLNKESKKFNNSIKFKQVS